MIEPVTATAAVLVADRVYDRVARARQRRALLNLLGGELAHGGEVGEHYGPHAGWYVKIPAAFPAGAGAGSDSADIPPTRDEPSTGEITAHRARVSSQVGAQLRGRGRRGR